MYLFESEVRIHVCNILVIFMFVIFRSLQPLSVSMSPDLERMASSPMSPSPYYPLAQSPEGHRPGAAASMLQR